MKLWKTVALLALSAEAAKRGGNKNRNQETTSSSTTSTSTTFSSTTFSTVDPLSALELAFVGAEFEDTAAGTTTSFTRNVDGTFMVLVRNSDNVIIAFDTATIDTSTGSITFDTAGAATFVDNQLVFDNGMLWGKTNGDVVDNGADTGTADSGTADSGTADSGTADSGTADSGTADSGTADSGTADSGTADSGTTDSGTDSGTGDSNTAGSESGTDTSSTDGGTGDSNTAGSESGTDSGTGDSNTAGSESGGTTATDAYGNGTGYVQGDPHVRVQLPGEQPLCYDIEAETMDYVSLIDDEGIDLEVNGRIEHVKESKNRLAEIGMQTAAGVQIAIDDQRVRIGMDGTFDNEYTFSEYQKLHIEDVTIEIFTPYEGKHNSVAIELDEGAQFMISSKSSKDSMKLAITRDYGLSSVVGGILGQTIRPNEYTMVEQTLIVEGRVIEGVNWDHDKRCFHLTEWDIPTFLGHQEKDYEVDGLFSKITKPWFTAMFEGLIANPK